MAYNNIKAENKLFAIADRQQGFFTSQQAIQAGFQDAVHPYHVKHGHWEREMRGVYRLARYPQSDAAQYVILSLWSRDRKGVPQGVLSHETALSIYDLSDVNPSKIHMSVPKGFRRQACIPKVLVLHYGLLYDDNDLQERRGFRVTRPARTVRDMFSHGSANPEIIEQALRDGYRTGRITVKELKALLKGFPASKHLFPSSIRKGRRWL
jgi:predicted transcriptional regulator of viral defense system